MLNLFKEYTPADLIALLNSNVFNQSKAESMLKNVDIKAVDKNGKNFYHHVVAHENVESIKWLAKYKLDINKEDNEGGTPLIIAAKAGMINAIKTLIAKGADINYKNKFGRNALQEAVLQGNTKAFDDLYRVLEDKNPVDNQGNTLLSLAILSNNIHMITKILDLGTIDINAKDKEGKTVLFHKSCLLQPEILKTLIQYDINLSEVDNEGNSFLFYCINEGVAAKDSFEMALENGADINIKNNNSGRTILMEYISQIREFENESADYKRNILDTISFMIYFEIDLDIQDQNGESAIFYALKCNELSVIELLLDSDADPNLINKDKETPLSITALQGYGQFRTATALVNAGALPNYKNSEGKSLIERLIDYELYVHSGKKLPLPIKKLVKDNGRYMALLELILKNSEADLKELNSKDEPYFFEPVFYGNLEIVKLLKTYGADINQKDKNQKNIIFRFMAMHETFRNDIDKKNYLNLLKNLIPMGVNLNDKDDFGGTTLHKAILANDEQTIKILINAGADLNAIDHRGRNMVHNTIWKNKIKLFRLIYSYNAKLLNKPDKFGVLPINYAAFLGYEDMVLELLGAGSQVNNPYPKGQYILDFLEKFHDNLKTLESKATTPIAQQKIRTVVEIMKGEFQVK